MEKAPGEAKDAAAAAALVAAAAAAQHARDARWEM
eukprot:gene6413-57477_t